MEILFIDIGSNTIKSLLARKTQGEIVAVAEFSIPKRISANQNLDPDAASIIEESIEELKMKASKFSTNFNIYCFGTSALRDFPDAPKVIKNLSEKNIHIRVLSGKEEAELSFKGAMTDGSLKLLSSDKILYGDIGGGSMEFAIGSPKKVDSTATLPLGAVRLTNMFLKDGNMDFQAMENFCGAELQKIPALAEPFKFIISGGAVTAARFILGNGKMSPNPVVTAENLKTVFDLSISLGPKGLSENFGTPQNRADILPAAFFCLIKTLRYFNKTEFSHTQHSLRYGIALEAPDWA